MRVCLEAHKGLGANQRIACNPVTDARKAGGIPRKVHGKAFQIATKGRRGTGTDLATGTEEQATKQGQAG